ncbi:MAG TPA: hypothetical protein VHU91_09800 [Mycobacteriales bacterium]|nr:hypothetical protein [Mycobacteriales bacterium]
MADDDDGSTAAGDGAGGSGQWRVRAEGLGNDWMAWRQNNRHNIGDVVTKVTPHVKNAIDKIHSSGPAQRLRQTYIGGKVAAQFAEGGAGKKAADKVTTFIAEKSKWSEHYVGPPKGERQPTAKWPGRVAAGTAAAGLFGYAVHRRNARRREEEALAAQLEQMNQAAYRPQAADPRFATAGVARDDYGVRL